MGPVKSWLSGLLVLAVAAAAPAQGVGPGDPDKKQEEKVKAAIAQFKKEYAEGEKKKDEGMRSTAFNVLHDVCGDQRVLDIVGKVLTNSNESANVKARAAMIVGMSGNLKAIPLLEKAYAANDKNDAAMEIVRAFGGIQDPSVLKILVKIVKPKVDRFDDDRASAIARCGIDAISRQRYPESIDALLGFYEPVAKAKSKDPVTDANQSSTEESLKSALSTLTAQQAQNLDEWKKWWAENKATFKFE